MKKRATLNDLRIGLKLVVDPLPGVVLKKGLDGLVVEVDDIRYRDNMFSSVIFTKNGNRPQLVSAELFGKAFMLYDELTDEERFIMKLSGKLNE